jgi:hypothetical protein
MDSNISMLQSETDVTDRQVISVHSILGPQRKHTTLVYDLAFCDPCPKHIVPLAMHSGIVLN